MLSQNQSGVGLRLQSPEDWTGLFAGANLDQLETQILPHYLPAQRWFASKSVGVRSARILDWAAIPPENAAIAFVQVEHEFGTPQFYTVPLALAFDEEALALRDNKPRAIVAPATTPDHNGFVYDAMWSEAFCEALLTVIATTGEQRTKAGSLRGSPSRIFDALRGVEPLPVRRSSAEQSNTSIFFGNRLILKLFRHPEPGENPDAELGRFLTEVAHFDRIPPFAGTVEYTRPQSEPTTVAMLQGLIANEGDGWKWMLAELDRYYESCARPLAREQDEGVDVMGARTPLNAAAARVCAARSLDSARVLGRRTAEMHLALSRSETDPAFWPEPVTAEYLQQQTAGIAGQATRALETLQRTLSQLPPSAAELGRAVLDLKPIILNGAAAVADAKGLGSRTRIHGDYHLGQVLVVGGDVVILDFEGEPARPLAQRRAKHSPLKDVAGMLRSFSYAAYASLMQLPFEATTELRPWAEFWEQSVASEFLRVYREIVAGSPIFPADEPSFWRLLEMYLLEKALYELLYELNNRPTWVAIPLRGILSLPQAAIARR
jgi:maltose alpha-D-glucosyltransferase/alpha-amylase